MTRLLSSEELGLVRTLLERAPVEYRRYLGGLEREIVTEMSDGEMGSLFFGQPREGRRMHKQIAELVFADGDNVPVSATLNVDERDQLFELDLSRADFRPLIRIPRSVPSAMRLSPALMAIVRVGTAQLSYARELLAQAEIATIGRCSPTMIDLEVPSSAGPLPVSDGPTETRTIVMANERPVGEILFWIKSGRLIGIEQAWFTEDPPQAWPEPASLICEL